ncbi:hypothetical protein DB346_06330 [Verrucomicrobia bacterium LW23]|nr:hypothetical protein DB346_06330 [Verrucomicrobia bacterium LW23]
MFYGIPDRYKTALSQHRISWPTRPLALVYGPAGTGKTHTVCDLVSRRLRGRHSETALMTTVAREVEAGCGRSAVVEALCNAEILVIDEFCGTEHDLRDASMATIREVVFDRLDRHNRTTFLITNRSPNWLSRHLDEPFVDRLNAHRELAVLLPMGPLPEARRGLAEAHHHQPDPEGFPELHFLLHSATCPATSLPKTLARFGKGEACCLSDLLNRLPNAAWEWLRQRDDPRLGILEELKNLQPQ